MVASGPWPGPGGAAARRGGVTIRQATSEDLPRCGTIWRDSLNDYMGRLNLPPIPDELGGLGRLHAHALATDPDTFVVAGRRGEPPVGFASAVARGSLWYLSMLFVDPAEQRAGLGRAMLGRILPTADRRDAMSLALASDSSQPISNGLYSSLGIVPRLPVYHLVGRPTRPSELPPLPPGVTAELHLQEAPLPGDLHALDRELLGFDHPQDHRFAAESGRRLFLFRARDGELVGYGYASSVGHVGPVAARDPALLAAMLGHLLLAIEPRGASALWLPGAAGPAFTALVRAGMRLDGFPILLCWDRPFADLDRYVLLSPGLP